MSDLSHWFCRTCRNPEYACDCGENEDLVPSVLMVHAMPTSKEEKLKLLADHPFFDDLEEDKK